MTNEPFLSSADNWKTLKMVLIDYGLAECLNNEK